MAAESERTAFNPQVETQAPQSYDDISDSDELHTIDFASLQGKATPRYEEVHDFGDQCYLLHDLLSEEENQFFIDKGEDIGFGKGIRGVKSSIRNCGRIMVQSPTLAEELWSRLNPFLNDIEIKGDPKDYHINGVTTVLQGTWRPHSINEIFRLCKYSPGGHFAPHFDGHLSRSPTLRSMKTLMLYLNGDFEGGTTNFIDEAQQLYQDRSSGRYCAEEKNIICRVKPEPGLAIIFNHHRLHEGQAIENNKKYILRTDILYERVGGPQVSDNDSEAMLLLQEAERLECQGDCMKAMELYRKAFKMSPALADYFNT